MPVRREYLIKRALLLVLVIFGVILITFFITRIIPARPELLWVGPHATIEQIEKARKFLHLDEPYHIQFLYYIRDLLTGNWGISWRTKTPVINDIKTHLPATLELIVFAFIIAIGIGIPLGVLAALKKYSIVDHFIRIFTVSGASVPVFWLALIAQLVLSNWLGVFPSAKRVDEEIVIETGFNPVTGFYLLDSLVQGNMPVFTSVIR
ncbi:MAG: ABC transporter permease, partial [Thermoprotei archaeon]